MVVLADSDATDKQQNNLPENAVQQNIVDEEPAAAGDQEIDEPSTKAATTKAKFDNAEDDEIAADDWVKDEIDLPEDDIVD